MVSMKCILTYLLYQKECEVLDQTQKSQKEAAWETIDELFQVLECSPKAVRELDRDSQAVHTALNWCQNMP